MPALKDPKGPPPGEVMYPLTTFPRYCKACTKGKGRNLSQGSNQVSTITTYTVLIQYL